MTQDEIKELRAQGYHYNKKLKAVTFKVYNSTCFFQLGRYEVDDTLALEIVSLDGEIYDAISVNLSSYGSFNIEALRTNEIYLDHNLKFSKKDPYVKHVINLLGATHCDSLETRYVTFDRLRLKDGFEKYCGHLEEGDTDEN